MTLATDAKNAGAAAVHAGQGILSRVAHFAWRHKLALAASTVVVAGAALAMQPQIAATVASNVASLPAAEGLTGGVVNAAKAAGIGLQAGLANSGPVWSVIGSGISSGASAGWDFAAGLAK